MHRFAQLFSANLIDANFNPVYLAPRLNRGAKNFTDQFQGAATLNRSRVAKLNCKARTLNGFIWAARSAARQIRIQVESGSCRTYGSVTKRDSRKAVAKRNCSTKVEGFTFS